MRLTASLFRRRALLAAAAAIPLRAEPPITTFLSAAPPEPRQSTEVVRGGRRLTHPASAPDDADGALALSELQGQLARTQSACLRLAQQLEARYVRYAWTEQLAADLRAIAHDTPGTAR